MSKRVLLRYQPPPLSEKYVAATYILLKRFRTIIHIFVLLHERGRLEQYLKHYKNVLFAVLLKRLNNLRLLHRVHVVLHICIQINICPVLNYVFSSFWRVIGRSLSPVKNFSMFITCKPKLIGRIIHFKMPCSAYVLPHCVKWIHYELVTRACFTVRKHIAVTEYTTQKVCFKFLVL